MSYEKIFKDMTDIYSRLFNHRAALQGLNQNFVKEFEVKRDDKLSLSRSQECLKNCTDCLQPATEQYLKEHVYQLSEAVQKASHSCQRILEDEAQKKTDWLKQERARRAQEWAEFTQGQIQERRQHTDWEFEDRAEGLRKHYVELEEKLNQAVVGKVL
ncbi:biogenesis of lysosome-related organelles complex 1 subunit 5-like [Plakobranchus ocellatus]|uniref:Biogenesis of lysosome-related organelles complex 1 subunit 5 n=1 Tax=Plakobranchus ocellatus TaxID=259542 RepID=A0AAV3ZF31_9GAST|nr:biogenesis of lysosome-related organelles complex 1 subunit 5-like [Plakobranchus ocellatus]